MEEDSISKLNIKQRRKMHPRACANSSARVSDAEVELC